jgi:hypothetical protein
MIDLELIATLCTWLLEHFPSLLQVMLALKSHLRRPPPALPLPTPAINFQVAPVINISTSHPAHAPERRPLPKPPRRRLRNAEGGKKVKPHRRAA